MSEFDAFVEAADKDLKMDTSTRSSKGCLTPPIIQSPRTPNNGTFSNSEGIKIYHQHRQITPKKLSDQDHPLKEGDGIESQLRWRSASKLSNRKSLIQPIVAPKSPEDSIRQRKSLTPGNGPPAVIKVDRNGEPLVDHSSPKSLSLPVIATSSDISLILQKMANKELELLEGKHRIEELRKKLETEEQSYKERVNELEQMKEFVGNQFQQKTEKQCDNAHSIKSTQNSSLESSTNSVNSESMKRSKLEHDNQVQSQSVWSKPLAIFNQFDQIIQQELEKTLNWDEPSDHGDGKDDTRGTHNLQATKLSNDVRQAKSEDQSVTRSIWNFVHDMKAGLLGGEQANESRLDESRNVASDEFENLIDIDSRDSETMVQFKSASNQKGGDENKWNSNNNKLRFVGDNDNLITNKDASYRQEVEMTDL